MGGKRIESPLCRAVGQGNLTLVQLLVSPGADVQVNYSWTVHRAKPGSKEYGSTIKLPQPSL